VIIVVESEEIIYEGQVLHIKGEPDEEEINRHLEWYSKYGINSLAIQHCCPACGGDNTEWIRNRWSICYDCEIAFNIDEDDERYIDTSVEHEDQDAIDYVNLHGE